MKILFLFLSLFLHLNLYAQNEFDDLIEEIIPKTQLSNAQLKNLREELRVQKILIQGVKELDILNIPPTKMSNVNQTLKDFIITSLGSKTKSLPKEVTSQITEAVRESIQDKNIVSTVSKIKEYASKSIHGKTAQLTSIARRFGVDAGIVYGVAMQFDYTLPLIMMSQGQVQLGATLLALPISSATTASYILAKKAIKFRQIVKELGGVQASIDHFNIFKQVKNFFHTNIWGKYDLIDLNLSGKNFVFTIEHRTLMQRLFSRLGWNKKLNYDNLLGFLKEEGLMTNVIANIEANKRPSQVKVLRILNQLEKNADETVIEKLKNRFSSYINEVDHLPNLTEERTWAIRASNSKSFQELYAHLASMPEDIAPRTLNRLWKNYILVEASKNIGPFISKETYQTFRNLYNSYDQIGSELMTSMDARVGSELKRKFTSYFYDAVPQLSACELNFHKAYNYSPSL